MRRRQGIARREAVSRTAAHGWQSEADAIAALKGLEHAPLPAIDPDIPDAIGVRWALQCAYHNEPVYAAAIEWRAAEHRAAGGVAEYGSTLGQALTYLSVHAMQRWFAERATASAPAPF